MTKPIAALLDDLETGQTTSESLTEACLARIEDVEGEGSKAFNTVYRESAVTTARAIDAQRKAGLPVGPLGGIPISIKDLLDEKGHVTTAGSVVLKDRPAAAEDAPVVARLRAAGAAQVQRHLANQIGKTHHILMENPLMGRTEQFSEVSFATPQTEGALVTATITGLEGIQLTA